MDSDKASSIEMKTKNQQRNCWEAKSLYGIVSKSTEIVPGDTYKKWLALRAAIIIWNVCWVLYTNSAIAENIAANHIEQLRKQ